MLSPLTNPSLTAEFWPQRQVEAVRGGDMGKALGGATLTAASIQPPRRPGPFTALLLSNPSGDLGASQGRSPALSFSTGLQGNGFPWPSIFPNLRLKWSSWGSRQGFLFPAIVRGPGGWMSREASSSAFPLPRPGCHQWPSPRGAGRWGSPPSKSSPILLHSVSNLAIWVLNSMTK